MAGRTGAQSLTLRSVSERTVLVTAEDEPRVWLLDARPRGLDEPGLRRWAREAVPDGDSPHTSRSYRHPFALIACHDAPVGIDIERVEPYDQAFHDSICTPEEATRPVDADGRDAYLSSLWSSKEALAKGLGDAIRYDPRHLGSPLFWPNGRAGPWRARRLAAPSGHVIWLCWRTGR